MIARVASVALLAASVSAGPFTMEKPRIVNGIPTTADDYPFIVDMRMDYSAVMGLFGNFSLDDLFGNFSWNFNGTNGNWTNGNMTNNWNMTNDWNTTNNWNMTNDWNSTNWNFTWPDFGDLFGNMSCDNDTECVSASFCTGSLLQLDWPVTILTAAHCVYNMTADFLGVYLGRSDQDANYSSTNNYSYHNVWKLEVHPNYNPYNLTHDIALMFLDENLTGDGRLGKVDIPETDTLSSMDVLEVIGYGANHSGGPATDTLEYTELYFIEDDECENLYNSYLVNHPNFTNETNITLSNSMMCALGNNTDSCQGDSGGPLIIKDTTTQVGLTSWGIGCNWGVPGVYTDIAFFYDWIMDTKDEVTYTTTTQTPDNSSDSDSMDPTEIAEGDGVAAYPIVFGLLMGMVAALME